MTSSHSLAVRHPDTILGESAIHTGPLLTMVLVFLFAANIYDPGGVLGLKYLAFFLLCVSALWTLKYFDLSSLEIIGGALLFVICPCWALLFGAVRKGDMLVGSSQVTPFLFGLVLTAVLCAFDKHRPLRLFYACLFSLAIVVIASFVLIYLLPDNPVSSALFDALTSLHEKEGYFGMRSLGDLEVPNIYFGSTLFLVPTFVYYLFVGRILRAGVVLLAIGLTFSKAGITIALVFAAIYSISVLFSRSALRAREGARPLLRKRLRKFLPVVVVGGIASVLLLSIPAFYDQIRDAWAGESETTLIRIRHFHSVMNLFLQNPHYLIVGQGVGVPFFTSGESSDVQNIEVDHLNTIRKFGLPWFAGFSGIVFFSASKLMKAAHAETRACGFALVSMYFAAGTNPVLISPLFILLLTLSYFAQRTLHARAS